MTFRIRVSRIDFDAASNEGYVYGQIVRQGKLAVYVELGVEKDYTPSQSDDPVTEYRFFSDCNVYVAETEDELDREVYLAQQLGVAVIIYC